MTIKNIYSMSDKAIARDIGQRIEQLRLESNVPQKTIAKELGITVKTYRNLVQGSGKFENVIGVLRVLNQLELIDEFIPSTPFSPMELLKLQGQKRQRASRPRKQPENQSGNGEPEW